MGCVSLANFVPSGTFSPVLGKSIALGYVPIDLAVPGSKLEVTVRGRNVPAEVVKRPFYKAGVTPLPPEQAPKEAV